MMKLIKILVISILFISCKNEQSNIDVLLHTEYNNSPFLPVIKGLKYQDINTKTFKGIHKNIKTHAILSYTLVSEKEEIKIQNLVEKGEINQNEISKLRKEVLVYTGFRKNNQFYSVNVNGDENFEDDSELNFPIIIVDSILTNRGLIDSFPMVKINYKRLLNNMLINDEMHLRFFPVSRFYTLDKDKNLLINKYPEANVESKRFDYFSGSFILKNQKYKLAYNKLALFKNNLIVVEKFNNAYLKKSDSRREAYTIYDTINLEGNYYSIEPITTNPLKISLKKLNIKANLKGFRKGQVVNNYPLEDLEGNKILLKDLFKGKEYILLDFWGTWCAPCKELTPKLKNFNNKYKEKINMVSLAYEKNPEPVKKYVTKNKMNWFNGIIKGTPKSGNVEKVKILSDLRVEAFPTFILLDKNLKIIFRGVGDNFKKIEKIIKEKN